MREFIDGATAIARGRAGCRLRLLRRLSHLACHARCCCSMMRELPKVGGVAIQAEDEIGAISMCIGAAMTGARVLTATSGPGISLYSENIGLAIMGEVPLVIVDVQRLGPATGGATTPGQGDVQFVRWGTSGGYPIIALSPGSVAECYSLTRRRVRPGRTFSRARLPADRQGDVPVDEHGRGRLVRATRRSAHRRCPGAAAGHSRSAPEETFLPYRFVPLDQPPPSAHTAARTSCALPARATTSTGC